MHIQCKTGKFINKPFFFVLQWFFWQLHTCPLVALCFFLPPRPLAVLSWLLLYDQEF